MATIHPDVIRAIICFAKLPERNELSFFPAAVMKDLSQYMPFGCENCKSEEYMPLRCCSGCRNNAGYFSYSSDSRLQGGIEEYVKLWSEEFGFWREFGCILPRWMRSWTCVRYKCNNKNGDKETRAILDWYHDTTEYVMEEYNKIVVATCNQKYIEPKVIIRICKHILASWPEMDVVLKQRCQEHKQILKKLIETPRVHRGLKAHKLRSKIAIDFINARHLERHYE